MVAATAPPPPVPEEGVADEADRDLRGRVLSRRTAISIAITLLVLGLAVWRSGIDWGRTGAEIRTANPGLYGLAVAVFYLSLMLRALRWQVLLRNTGERVRYADLLETLLASFFVNCVVPAKMGDLYRAVQLRSRRGVGGGRSLGTIIAERMLDLFVLVGLLAVAGAVTFRDRVPRALVPYFVAGVALCLAAGAILAVLTSGRGQRVLQRLPEAAVRRYESFRTGTVDAFGRWDLVIPASVGVWALEGTRLGLVVLSLGRGQDVGPAHFLLVALVAALLTTVPFLPGGLVLVEGGIVAVLVTITDVSRTTATGIALLDRSISYASLVVVGGLVFLLFHHRRHPRPTVGARARS